MVTHSLECLNVQQAADYHAALLPHGCLLYSMPDDALSDAGIARGDKLRFYPPSRNPAIFVACRALGGLLVRRYAYVRLGWLRLTADETFPGVWVRSADVVGVVVGKVQAIGAVNT
jgi:hypothetical protein